MAAAQPCALISSSTFQKDGLLVIVFDEAETSDSTDGGGHVAALIVSPKASRVISRRPSTSIRARCG